MKFSRHQMRNHLGVRFRLERHSASFQAIPELPVVFDDAVLHHGHPTIDTSVRVGIALLRLAMGGPTRVADAALPGGPQSLHPLTEVDELAFGPQAGELSLAGHRRQASGVVAAVLQLPQTFEQLWCCRLGSHEGNDSAHEKSPAQAGQSLWRDHAGVSRPSPWSGWFHHPGRPGC